MKPSEVNKKKSLISETLYLSGIDAIYEWHTRRESNPQPPGP